LSADSAPNRRRSLSTAIAESEANFGALRRRQAGEEESVVSIVKEFEAAFNRQDMDRLVAC